MQAGENETKGIVYPALVFPLQTSSLIHAALSLSETFVIGSLFGTDVPVIYIESCFLAYACKNLVKTAYATTEKFLNLCFTSPERDS
jgi:hypothetical protein